ncbi:MAG: hypothetical protein O3A46_01700 [Candidatus Poribacteria bacterium]|nr:hypothetical protein [Candidatus Poribacteria bacterium]
MKRLTVFALSVLVTGCAVLSRQEPIMLTDHPKLDPMVIPWIHEHPGQTVPLALWLSDPTEPLREPPGVSYGSESARLSQELIERQERRGGIDLEADADLIRRLNQVREQENIAYDRAIKEAGEKHRPVHLEREKVLRNQLSDINGIEVKKKSLPELPSPIVFVDAEPNAIECILDLETVSRIFLIATVEMLR